MAKICPVSQAECFIQECNLHSNCEFEGITKMSDDAGNQMLLASVDILEKAINNALDEIEKNYGTVIRDQASFYDAKTHFSEAFDHLRDTFKS